MNLSALKLAESLFRPYFTSFCGLVENDSCFVNCRISDTTPIIRQAAAPPIRHRPENQEDGRLGRHRRN